MVYFYLLAYLIYSFVIKLSYEWQFFWEYGLYNSCNKNKVMSWIFEEGPYGDSPYLNYWNISEYFVYKKSPFIEINLYLNAHNCLANAESMLPHRFFRNFPIFQPH